MCFYKIAIFHIIKFTICFGLYIHFEITGLQRLKFFIKFKDVYSQHPFCTNKNPNITS